MNINKLQEFLDYLKSRNDLGLLECGVTNFFIGGNFDYVVLSMERYDRNLEFENTIDSIKDKFGIKSYECLEGWEEDTWGVLLRF